MTTALVILAAVVLLGIFIHAVWTADPTYVAQPHDAPEAPDPHDVAREAFRQAELAAIERDRADTRRPIGRTDQPQPMMRTSTGRTQSGFDGVHLYRRNPAPALEFDDDELKTREFDAVPGVHPTVPSRRSATRRRPSPVRQRRSNFERDESGELAAASIDLAVDHIADSFHEVRVDNAPLLSDSLNGDSSGDFGGE